MLESCCFLLDLLQHQTLAHDIPVYIRRLFPYAKFPARGFEQDRVDVLRSRWPPVALIPGKASIGLRSDVQVTAFFPIWDLRVLVMLRRLCHIASRPVSRGLRFFPLGTFLAEVIGVADPMFFTHERGAE